jgi:curved DNA-binding protein
VNVAEFKDYYQVLGVKKDASKEEIRRAFRKLAATHHPDRNPGDDSAEERFKELNEAYTVLADEEKRKLYDTYGRSGGPAPFAGGAYGGSYSGGTGPFPGGQTYTNVSPEEFAGFSDFFQSLFGGFAGRAGQSGNVGADPFSFGRGRTPAVPTAEARLDVGLLDAHRGGPTTIRVEGKELELNIPAGVRDGAKLRLRGQAPGGGDLILQIRHLPQPGMKLDGDTLRVQVRVPDHVAALGGSVPVTTLDGELELTVPPASSTGRVLRLRGQGWHKKDGGRGDALVEVRVTVPETLSPEQKRLYGQLAASSAPGGGSRTGPAATGTRTGGKGAAGKGAADKGAAAVD